MKYKFRVPYKCSNGHFRYLYFDLKEGGLIGVTQIIWGDKEEGCNSGCSTIDMPEEFHSFGPAEMWSGWTDKDEEKIYHNDVCCDNTYGANATEAQ